VNLDFIMARIIALITGLILAFLLGYKAGYNTALSGVVADTVVIEEREVDTVYVEKGYYVDTLPAGNEYCSAIVIADTIVKDSIVVIRDTVSQYEITLRKYYFEDTLIRASLWANYVDTSSFRYSLKKPLVSVQKGAMKKNRVAVGFLPDGTVVHIGYSRLLFDRVWLGANWLVREKGISIEAGVAF